MRPRGGGGRPGAGSLGWSPGTTAHSLGRTRGGCHTDLRGTSEDSYEQCHQRGGRFSDSSALIVKELAWSTRVPGLPVVWHMRQGRSVLLRRRRSIVRDRGRLHRSCASGRRHLRVPKETGRTFPLPGRRRMLAHLVHLARDRRHPAELTGGPGTSLQGICRGRLCAGLSRV